MESAENNGVALPSAEVHAGAQLLRLQELRRAGIAGSLSIDTGNPPIPAGRHGALGIVAAEEENMAPVGIPNRLGGVDHTLSQFRRSVRVEVVAEDLASGQHPVLSPRPIKERTINRRENGIMSTRNQKLFPRSIQLSPVNPGPLNPGRFKNHGSSVGRKGRILLECGNRGNPPWCAIGELLYPD